MKKRLICLCLMVVCLSTTGCKPEKKEKEMIDYAFATVETTTKKYKSVIRYFDDKLSEITSERLNYAGMYTVH